MVRIIFVIIGLMLSYSPAFSATARVVTVFDGDSLHVEIQGQQIRVRLYGIDAPESGQQGNASSTRFLRHLLLRSEVEMTVMEEDVFGWTIAVLTLAGQRMSVNASIVANGYAWVNPDKCAIADCGQMKTLEAQARRLRLGIWSGYDLVPPWEFNARRSK